MPCIVLFKTSISPSQVFFCFNYAPLNLFRKFQFWFILSFQNFGFWNPHPPSISNNPLRVGISIFWYHTWLFHWSIMYIVFTLGWFRECSGCRLHDNRAYFTPSVSRYVLKTFLSYVITVEPLVVTSSHKRPVFQNNKSFQVKSPYLEPLVSDHLS